MSDELSNEEFKAMKAMYSKTIASLHAENETLTRRITALEAQLAAQSEIAAELATANKDRLYYHAKMEKHGQSPDIVIEFGDAVRRLEAAVGKLTTPTWGMEDDKWPCAGKCGEWHSGQPAAHNGSGPVCEQCEASRTQAEAERSSVAES